METLKQLSTEHLNETVSSLGENNRLLNIARITKDKNSILKLEFQRKSILSEIEYHKAKINEV